MRCPAPYCRTYTFENYFSLFIEQNINSTKIKMLLLKDPTNTSDIPFTFQILKNLLPSVLTTECFNDRNLPFHQEVKNTEIGHLFEHILLEYMCQLKIAKGCNSAIFYGRTKWNWNRDPRGVFHININCSLKDADIFPAALNKTVSLMKTILQAYSSSILYPIKSGSNLYPPMSSAAWYLGLKNGKKRRKK